MQQLIDISKRPTTTDLVFKQLHDDIVSLRVLPGTKLSEVEVAKRFGVSRQPVRDAINRLYHQDLVLIQPQKATKVRGFSLERINRARFVRLAVELEVIQRACAVWDDSCAAALQQNLDQQQEAIRQQQGDQFHQIDSEFHTLICELSGCESVIPTIRECRQKTDRLCVLSIDHYSDIETILADHEAMADALHRRSIEDATRLIRNHLSRLDDTIAAVHEAHAEYFE